MTDCGCTRHRVVPGCERHSVLAQTKQPHFPATPIVGTRSPRGGQTRWFIFYKPLDPDYAPAFQDEYQRLWHDAAATRDRYKAALKLIYRGYVHAPTISDPWDPQKIAGDVLEVAA